MQPVKGLGVAEDDSDPENSYYTKYPGVIDLNTLDYRIDYCPYQQESQHDNVCSFVSFYLIEACIA